MTTTTDLFATSSPDKHDVLGAGKGGAILRDGPRDSRTAHEREPERYGGDADHPHVRLVNGGRALQVTYPSEPNNPQPFITVSVAKLKPLVVRFDLAFEEVLAEARDILESWANRLPTFKGFRRGLQPADVLAADVEASLQAKRAKPTEGRDAFTSSGEVKSARPDPNKHWQLIQHRSVLQGERYQLVDDVIDIVPGSSERNVLGLIDGEVHEDRSWPEVQVAVIERAHLKAWWIAMAAAKKAHAAAVEALTAAPPQFSEADRSYLSERVASAERAIADLEGRKPMLTAAGMLQFKRTRNGDVIWG